jgi:hypothetical protein
MTLRVMDASIELARKVLRICGRGMAREPVATCILQCT